MVVFQEAIDPLVIERLSKETGLFHWASRRSHSIAFISRLEVASHEWHRPEGARHSFLEIVLGDGRARIFGLHLSARFSKWSERQRVREIKALLKDIEKHQDGFHVLVGDFNTLAPGELLDVKRMPAWIRALVWLSGRDIQRDTIRAMMEARYLDGYRMLHPSDKGYTFPTWDPHLRLDYVFVPERFSGALAACEVINHESAAATASDHFPLLAHINFQ